MTSEFIRRCVLSGKLRHTRHSAEVRLERGVSNRAMKQALMEGTIIEREPHDVPRPSVLVLGWLASGDPLHVKCSRGAGEDFVTIVTLYEPDERFWQSDFKTRRKGARSE